MPVEEEGGSGPSTTTMETETSSSLRPTSSPTEKPRPKPKPTEVQQGAAGPAMARPLDAKWLVAVVAGAMAWGVVG